MLRTKTIIGLLAGLGTAAIVGVNLWMVERLAPRYGLSVVARPQVERARAVLSPVPAAAAPRHRRLPRAGRRPAGVRPLADLPALAQPRPLRPARRPVRPRRQLLHLRAAVPAGGVRLAVHHPGPDHPAGRGRPLRARRDPPPGRDQPHRRPGPVAPVRAARPDRRPQGLGLLAGQVPAAVLAPRGGRRRLLHRRQGPAASPRGAVLGRPDLRRRRSSGGAAGRAARPPDQHRAAGRGVADPGRHHPGGVPAVPGRAPGAGPRAALHREEHRRHPQVVQPERGLHQGVPGQQRPHRAGPPGQPADARQHPAVGPRGAAARASATSRPSPSTTTSPTSTSTATRSATTTAR